MLSMAARRTAHQLFWAAALAILAGAPPAESFALSGPVAAAAALPSHGARALPFRPPLARGGSGRVALRMAGGGCSNEGGRKRWTWEEAKAYARSFGWETKEEFMEYGCAGAYSLPKNPEEVYASEWTDWGDFLGSKLPFDEARALSRTLGLKSEKEWKDMVARAGDGEVWFNGRVPSMPDKVLKYKGQWVSWEDWLGL